MQYKNLFLRHGKKYAAFYSFSAQPQRKTFNFSVLDYRKLYKYLHYNFLMLKIKKISGMIGKRVFTDAGDAFGEIEECILAENKIDSWRMRVSKEMARGLNGARGVIIPHQFVKAIGDVVVINKASLPISEAEEVSNEETMDLSAGQEQA